MIKELLSETESILSGLSSCRKLLPDMYTDMRYPQFLPVMTFHVDRYDVAGFGHIMIMHTLTKMGMELLTMSFMPSEAVLLPYLLIDAMNMKKKRCVFAEYYGCGYNRLYDRPLEEVYEKYRHLPDYTEKDHWYIKERLPYSLIKSGPEDDLLQMAAGSVSSYMASVGDAGYDKDYLPMLKSFRERMITKGNPASRTLKMMLKEDGARDFIEKAVMPL